MLGARIRELRVAKNLTQQDIGEILDVDFTTISKWEKGKYDPSLSHLSRLADLFGVTTDYLLCRTDERTGTVVTSPTTSTDDRVLAALAGIEAKLDKLAGEIAGMRATNTGQIGELTQRIEDSETDIRLLKKLATKE